MIQIGLQFFGGRGSKGSGGGRGGRAGGGPSIKNSSGASERAVEIMGRAMQDVKTYGMAQIEINSSTSFAINRAAGGAGKVVDKAFERELQTLANENGYSVNFRSTTKASAGIVQALRYGTQQKNTRTNRRIAYFYKG